MEEDIKKYIKEALSSGATKEEIKKVLKDNGWDDNKIESVFLEDSSKEETILQPPLPSSSPPSEKPSTPVEFPKPNLSGEESSFCRYCGTPFKKDATYCPYCGKGVFSSEETPVNQSISSLPKKDRSGFAITSLVLGILSLIFGPITGIPALIFGIIGIKSTKKNLAIVGIIMSIIFGIVLFILGLIFLASLNRAKDIARDSRIKSSMRQIRSSAVIYYSENNSYEGLEKDFNLSRLESEIKQNGGQSFSINASSSSYCSEVMLPSKKWFCIDSNFSAKEHESDPPCSKNKISCE